MSTKPTEIKAILQKDQPINFHRLPIKVINKIFKLLEDKYLLRLREACHTVKEKIDVVILNVRKLTAYFEFTYLEDPREENNVRIDLDSYFDVLGYRSYTFLRIAITQIATELPIITIKAHDYRGYLSFTLKLEDFNTFLDRLKPRIAGVRWRQLSLNDAPIAIVRTFADFFNGNHVNSIDASPMTVENSDYSTWLTLIKNVTAAKFRGYLKVISKDEVKFLIDLSENVYCAEINFKIFESSISFVSIVKAMFSRKCFLLNFFTIPFGLFAISNVESLLAFVHKIDKEVSFSAFMADTTLKAQVGAYSVDVFQFDPQDPELSRVVIEPIAGPE